MHKNEEVLTQRGIRVFAKPQNIERLLSYPIKENLSLSVQIEAYKLDFHSRFSLKTNLSEKRLILEEPFPNYGNELLKGNRLITVKCQKGDFVIYFTVPFEKGWEEEGTWLWALQYPQTVVLKRLRMHTRVEPASSDVLTIYFAIDEEAVLGHIIQLSLGGALFASRVREPTIQVGQAIEEMHISLPDRTLRMNAEIVRVSAMNCAIQFTSMSGEDKNALRNYIADRVSQIKQGFGV
ncbi:PilZ domain-containing protein [bacterium]|nr:PilZ domain-containing protein [bacterium]